MKHLLLISFLSLTFSQELKVEGNLNVTGAVINDSLVQVIDSLKATNVAQQTQVDSLLTLHSEQQSLIEQLQAQIIFLGQQFGLADCNGDFGGDAVEDNCGVCDNDASNDGSYDNCGVCDNDATNDCLQDCAGNWGGDAELDACGICDGDAVSEEECFSVFDIDGNGYETVVIGEQEWMAENLKVTHYNNGDPITHITNNGDWGSYDEGQYGVYDNDPSYADTYGNLYNWAVVDDDRGVCPEGFHVPSDEEYMTLEMYLGMSESEANSTGYRGTNEGSKLAGNADLWNSGNLDNNAEFGTSGFNTFPGGLRSFSNGNYSYMGNIGSFWSSSESNSSTTAWRRLLSSSMSSVLRYITNEQDGYSVRCVRN